MRVLGMYSTGLLYGRVMSSFMHANAVYAIHTEVLYLFLCVGPIRWHAQQFKAEEATGKEANAIIVHR